MERVFEVLGMAHDKPDASDAVAWILVGEARWAAFSSKRDLLEAESSRLAGHLIRPGDVEPDLQQSVFGTSLSREQNALELLRRPEVGYAGLMRLPGLGPGVDRADVAEQLEIQARYHGYIERQKAEIERSAGHEDTLLPDAIDYYQVRGLSAEAG